MNFRRKIIGMAIIALGAFLLATVSPASLMLCKMAMANCPTRCAEPQKNVPKNSSYEAACSKDCCLTFNRSSSLAVAPELKNISEGKVKSLALLASQPFLISESVAFQAVKFHSLERFHPPAPHVYLMKSSFLI